MVSQVAYGPGSRSLESLPARPPTPPREKKPETDSSSKHILSNHPVDIRLNNLHTPPNYSPNSTENADNPDASSRRSTKKVGFLAQAEYRDAPTYVKDKENVRKQPTPISIPSSTNSLKPIKSILKQSSSPVPRNPLDSLAVGDEATGQINITAMLDSTIKQLAGADRDSKIDAYMMLARALKTSNNLPDRIALQEKMSLFMQFIQRDVTAKGPNGNMDSSMVNHALTLLCTFCHFPAIASTLSSDFGVFIIDHCIRSFDDEAMPKDVARHLMQVVASQEFSPKVMTADRVGRLIASLHKIEQHLKGKSIVMSRIWIYRKLVKQCKSHMVTHSDWLWDLFTDMLSSMKEIRNAAITLGLEASFSIGKEKQVSRKVMEILQKQIKETKYIEYYVQRLMSMVEDKAVSAAVPQVWSVIILLLKCPLDRWEFFGPWLEIIQRCFNSSDHQTRLEANYAWSRLVYALHFNVASFSKTIHTVCQPFHSQLKRRGSSKQMEELRRVAVASVCNLYYYAFKPNLSPTQVDSYWDACVLPVMQGLIFPEPSAKQNEKHTPATEEKLEHATHILTGLLDSSTPRLWKEDRVADNPLAKPDELPALDPKWVRRNSARVFAVVEPILEKTFLDIGIRGSISNKLWRTLVGAVAAAASKEVKVSTDTATFMAYTLGFLARMWSQGLSDADLERDCENTPYQFFDSVQMYLGILVESLGLLPFTEKLFSLNKENSFVPVATTSHRSGKGQGLTRTPLHHLYAMLSVCTPNIPVDDDLKDLIMGVFDPFLIARTSSHAKKELARELMQTVPLDTVSDYPAWVFIAQIYCSYLDNSQSSSLTTTSGSEPATVGHEYREFVKHLEKGIKFTPWLPWEHWNSLFERLVARVTQETGEAGCAIAVVEPLARSLSEFLPHNQEIPSGPLSRFACCGPMFTYMRSGIDLIATAKQPRDKQALDAARRRLWGTSIGGSRSSFDPFDHFYRFTNHLLEKTYTYKPNEMFEHHIVVPLLSEVASFLGRCDHALVLKSLAQLQHGISFWIQDAKAHYRRTSVGSVAVMHLWDRVCSLFPDAVFPENFQLDVFEELLCSAFQSKNRRIVNAVATMWNCSFEHADEIKYPEKLKKVLIYVHHSVDVVLPGIDLSSYDYSGEEPAFIESEESQDDLEALEYTSDSGTHTSDSEVHRETAPAERPSSGSAQLPLPTTRRRDTTPTPLSMSAENSTTPRPRHDDSQIQFAAIESSSPTRVLESQLLTDRQKEVRERQRENAVLYSDIQATTAKDESPAPASGHSEQTKQLQERAATPEPRHDVEDYVSSTPTPRRGQAHIIDDDHEMTDDIPSSPPEPRRNLLVEMKPRSRSSSVFHEFPMSSSPVSGSPVPKRQLSVHQAPIEQEDAENVEDNILEAMNDEELDEAIEPELEHMPTGVKDKSNQSKANEIPLTPRKTRSMGKVLESSPRSDREVFVDALTSPVQTPRTLRSRTIPKGPQPAQKVVSASEAKDRSFELSDGEERSMARLVIELDSRKCEPGPRHDSSSPEKSRVTEGSMECITVKTGSKRSRRKAEKGEGIQPEPVETVIPSSPTTETESSQSSSKKSKKKRKRHAEKNEEPGSGRKKRKHRKDTDVDAESVPDSQSSRDGRAETAGMHAAVEENMHLDTDIPFNSSQDLVAPDAAAEESTQSNSSPVSYNDSVVSRESDTEAVNLQIITEASQQTEMEESVLVEESTVPIDEDTKMEDEAEEAAAVVTEEAQLAEEKAGAEPAVEKSAAEKIMDAMRAGLEGLRTASLTREEASSIEDMFFDIKKELYQAESRGRH